MIRAAIGVVALIAALLTSPPAGADAQTFYDAVGTLGYPPTPNTLRNGYTVCVLRTESDADFTSRAIRRLLLQLGRDAEAANSDEFTALSLTHLCPELAR